jgi:hypothetical protein
MMRDFEASDEEAERPREELAVRLRNAESVRLRDEEVVREKIDRLSSLDEENVL